MTTTLLEEPIVRPSTSPSQRLRTTMAAVRMSLSWFGIRKTLTAEQKTQAADTFGAEGAFLSAGKKLLDTAHPAFKAVTAVKGRIVALWKSMSLPYPEPGIRLIRQDQIEAFNTQIESLKGELDEAVRQLDQHYAELKSAARDRLGSLYNPADYPGGLLGLFQVAWDYPSVEPADFLAQLNPEIYRQECERVAARFDEAVQLAEQAFIGELQDLVSHLTERLNGQADTGPEVKPWTPNGSGWTTTGWKTRQGNEGLDSRNLAHRGEINDKLVVAVHPHQPIHQLLMVRCHGTCACPNGFASQVKVLADMPGIQGDDLVGRQPVPPFHAVRHGCPDERDRRIPNEGLSQRGLDDLPPELRFLELQEQFVLQRQVAIHAQFQALDAEGQQVGLQRMSGTGGGYCPQGRALVEPLLHTLGRPEQER